MADNPTFGVDDASYGLTQTRTSHTSAEVGEARGGDGKVKYQQAYSVTTDIEEQVVLTGDLPSIGSVDDDLGIVP